MTLSVALSAGLLVEEGATLKMYALAAR